jgi:CheY-like chemotaxis protein
MRMHIELTPVCDVWLKAEGSKHLAFSAADSGLQQSTGKKQVVLVVDDESPIADSVAEILQDEGYAAAAVYSGEAAIEYAREHCPDIVMCDVLMPKMNGVETAMAIRNLCTQARIILFSGQAATVDILKRASVDSYQFELLPKPIHPDDLLRTLRS